ncbi:MAG: TolC family protein [Oscillatoriales cyanobacterium C42_A2020_001]|nr:TolC family protein [Leptolyngbyaceae cyanobacterium C42_A2020_001]
MRPSRQFLAAGVGVLVAFGQTPSGLSQTVEELTVSAPESAQSPKPAATSKVPEADSSPAQESSAIQQQVGNNNQSSSEVTLPSDALEAKPDAPRTHSGSTVLDQPTPEKKPNQKKPEVKRAIAQPQKKPNSKKPTSVKKTAAKSNTRQAKTATPALPIIEPIDLSNFKAQQAQTTQTAPPPVTTPSPMTPTPATLPGQLNPNGSLSLPGDDGFVPTAPIGSAKPGVAPDYLNPPPNPLYFPTRPEDVKARGIQPITLQQALELGKRNNRDLQRAFTDLDRSRAELREAQAALYPTLTGQLGLTQSQSPGGQLQEEAARQQQANIPRQFRQIPDADNSSLQLNGTVSVNYNIYTSGLRPAQIRGNEQVVRSSELKVEIIEQNVRLNVATAYYNLQQADENVRIQQSAVRNAEASLRDTQAQERAGLGTRFDVLRAQVQLARARQDLTVALRDQQVRRSELSQILATPPNIDLAAADPVQIAGTWNLTLPQSIVLAFKNRAELAQLLAQRERFNQARKVALASIGPTVGLRVDYNVANNLRDTLGFGDGYSVSANLNWNFFDGGAARARANQQEANQANVEIQFAQQREDIQRRVEEAYFTLQSSFLNIDTNRQAVVQAREALRLARLRFQAGVGTQTEVINSENDLTLAEGRLVNAILDYNRAIATLQRQVTNLPIATGSTTPSIPTPAPTTRPTF